MKPTRENTPFTIRTMSRADLDLVVEWAAREGWNPGLHDASSFLAADPSGFLLGLMDDRPVATISVVRYGNSFGFLGFYIVLPEERGKGYGLQIWKAGLEHLRNRTVGLDGVIAQQANYRKSGFVFAYRNIRFQGVVSEGVPRHPGIVPLSTVPFDALWDYDRPFFPDDRRRFLESWVRQPESISLGFCHQGSLIGYGVIRPCRSGYKIGPLFADHPDTAEALFLALQASARPGQPLFLDTPEPNPAALALAQKYKMSPMFETARMYLGTPPNLPLERLFGVTTFELG